MATSWLDRRVLAYAHQGGAFEAPSSTLYAIERAIGLGATGIELDVHATSDRRLVVCHDATVDRTTNGFGAIASMSFAEVKELDNAHFFVPEHDVCHDQAEDTYVFRGRAPADSRFAVASLEEVLDLTTDVLLNLDIKKGAPEVEPYEAELAALLVRSGRAESLIVSSFNDHVTARFASFAPGIGTAPGVSEITGFVQAIRANEPPDRAIARHVAIQVPARWGGEWLIDDQLVDAAHRLGLAVHAWTVNEESEMSHLLDCGVDAIMTDRPSVLVTLLDRRGLAYVAPRFKPS